MNPFYAGALAALRRRLANHQDRPRHSSEPLWRLLAEEVSLLLRWLARRTPLRAWLPALLVGLAVGIGFGDGLQGRATGILGDLVAAEPAGGAGGVAAAAGITVIVVRASGLGLAGFPLG